MVEPESAFCDLDGLVELACSFLKNVIQEILNRCEEDLAFFEKRIDSEVIDRLKHVVEVPFERITYTEAIRLLESSDESFEFPVRWGLDLQSEHERYLTEKRIQKPLIVVDYPKEIKAFYMYENADEKTVRGMDLLVPRIGELIGGAQREDREAHLQQRMKAAGLAEEEYGWYLELRRYGGVPHAGFGLGFERLIQFVTGMANIRDVIPFPRVPGYAAF